MSCCFSGVLYFVSSTVNPILYNLMSKKYREAFKETLCRCCLPPEQRRKRDSRGRIIGERSMTCYTVAGGNSTRSVRERELISLVHKQAPRVQSSSDSSDDGHVKMLAAEHRLLASQGNNVDSINGNVHHCKDDTNSTPLLEHDNSLELAHVNRSNGRSN